MGLKDYWFSEAWNSKAPHLGCTFNDFDTEKTEVKPVDVHKINDKDVEEILEAKRLFEPFATIEADDQVFWGHADGKNVQGGKVEKYQLNFDGSYKSASQLMDNLSNLLGKEIVIPAENAVYHAGTKTLEVDNYEVHTIGEIEKNND